MLLLLLMLCVYVKNVVNVVIGVMTTHKHKKVLQGMINPKPYFYFFGVLFVNVQKIFRCYKITKGIN